MQRPMGDRKKAFSARAGYQQSAEETFKAAFVSKEMT